MASGTSSKKTSKNKKPPKPIQETLHEQAALRLKAFIEDLRYDPMFRHRLFYPVLYKEIVRGAQYTKDNEVRAAVAEVIYEYYLLKMEKFDSDKAAQIFQAILLSNGPMLPKEDRFVINDADNANSILNPKNRDNVVHRTRVLLIVLQDENLYNFVFRSTVGGNLDNMRQKFKELVKNIHITASGYKIQDKIIEKSVSLDWQRALKGKNPVVTPLEKNITVLSEYFEHIRDKDIQDVVGFLIYMGKSRNIVTDFSYRPMTQDMLEKYTEYGLSPQDEKKLEYRNQIEQALDSNVLQKDLTAQMDSFIPVITREYAAICTGEKRLLDWSTSYKLSDYNIKNSLKLKLQRTLKQIGDYTRNYLTKELLDTDPENPKKDKFISQVVAEFYEGLKKNKSVSDLSRKVITYDKFLNHKTDLSYFIFEIFKNDINYINEICDETDKLKERKDSFQQAWDQRKLSKDEILLDRLKEDIEDLLDDIGKCFKVRTYEADNIEKIVQNIITRQGLTISIGHIRASIRSELNNAFSKIGNLLNNDTVAERMVQSIINNAAKAISKTIKHLSGIIKHKIEKILIKILAYIEIVDFSITKITGYIASIKTATDYDNAIKQLELFYGLKYINWMLKEYVLSDEELKEIENISPGYAAAIEKFIKNVNKCFIFNDEIAQYISEYDNLFPEDYLRKIASAKIASKKISEKINEEPLAEHLLEIYFKYYLKPVLINFFGYAFDNFIYNSRRNDVEADIISKDILHFSTLLTPSNVGLLTFDGAVIQDLAKFTYVLMSDTFSGITYNSPDSVIKFLDKVYGITYFNVIIYGRNDAYVYMNNVGVPYLYRGAKTKIPIRELRNNYDFLMDPSRGLYKNISLPKKKH